MGTTNHFPANALSVKRQKDMNTVEPVHKGYLGDGGQWLLQRGDRHGDVGV